jgi:DNA repair exonuclease SbcCD nuclease subunit
MNDLGKFDLKRSVIFSDIHFGKRGEIHNKDCLDFIDFMTSYVADPKNGIDHIVFMGDWFDKRDSINISTLNYSHQALTKLNKLGIPIFIETGNHDLYLRNNRNIHSLIFFNEFNNCYLIDTPTTAEISGARILFMPYIFQEEYVPMAVEVNGSDIVYAHLELKGFVLTGSTVVLEHGHDQALFDKPKRIFTGHFHKRQNKGNVFYTGNPFPFDFSDTNDINRGFAIYDYATDTLEFQNHLDAPSYIKCSLSKLLTDHKKILKPKGIVHCAIDTEISMEEHTAIKDRFMEKYNLRELNLSETSEDIGLTGDVELDDEKLETTDAMILSLLEKVVVENLNKDKLITIYENLQ